MAERFTIITVNLNDAAGLRATADSVAAQTFGSYQWLILDGGSTDGSLDVIRAFAPLADGWWSAPDGGVYQAMNRGLARARGEFVIFMNAGDQFADATALARIDAALESARVPDLLLGGTLLELPSGRRMYRPPRPPTRHLRCGPPAYHQATVFRRTVHARAPYDLALPISADYGAIATMFNHGASWARLDQPLAVRHCARDSLSERRTLARFRDFVRIQRRILERPWPEVACNLVRQLLVYLAYVLVRDGWITPRNLMQRPRPEAAAKNAESSAT